MLIGRAVLHFKDYMNGQRTWSHVQHGNDIRQIAKLSTKKKLLEDATQTNSFNNHILTGFQIFMSLQRVDVKMANSMIVERGLQYD